MAGFITGGGGNLVMMVDESGSGSGTPDEEPVDGEAAEERVAEWGRRVGRFIATAAARAREEAEDIVAEAQSIRRGEEQQEGDVTGGRR